MYSSRSSTHLFHVNPDDCVHGKQKQLVYVVYWQYVIAVTLVLAMRIAMYKCVHVSYGKEWLR